MANHICKNGQKLTNDWPIFRSLLRVLVLHCNCSKLHAQSTNKLNFGPALIGHTPYCRTSAAACMLKLSHWRKKQGDWSGWGGGGEL